jgi:putative exosortase-associated protein (TIGR04073 family)
MLLHMTKKTRRKSRFFILMGPNGCGSPFFVVHKAKQYCYSNYKLRGEAMYRIGVLLPFLFCTILAAPAFAEESQPPAAIVEKMAFKLTRGVTNVATCIAEIPKQTMNSVRDRGTIGYVIGPLKGIGMTLYRGIVGGVETIFFMVPQPGYYDPMVDPEYVWHGWGDPKPEKPAAKVE